MALKVNQDGVNLIKRFEGLRLQAYLCPAGVATIGYGTTKGIKLGMTITKEKAEQLLRDDLVIYENKVNKYDSKYNWTQSELNAMTSFCYNIGNIDQLTANGTRTKTEIVKMMPEYRNKGTSFEKGLLERRKAEVMMFLSGSNESNNETKTSSPTTQTKLNYTTGNYVVTASKMNVRVGHGTNYRAKELKELSASAQKQGGYINGVVCSISEIYQTETETWGLTPSGWICIQNANGTYCKKK